MDENNNNKKSNGFGIFCAVLIVLGLVMYLIGTLMDL